MKKEELLKVLRKYPLGVETHKERFRMLCESVTVNGFCFRDVCNIHIVDDVLWIHKTSIDIKDIKKFRIRESEQYCENGNNIYFKVTPIAEEE